MTQLGADPDHLREFARSMRSAAGQLDTLSLGLARRTRVAGWRGPDADAFERQWQLRHRPALRATADDLSALSRRVQQQVDQQIAASSADPSAGSATAPIPASGSTAATASRTNAPTGTADEPFAPLPRSEDRYVGGVTLKGAVLTATIEGDLTIARLDHGRVQVDVSRTAAVGVGAAVGSSASLTMGGTSVDRAPVTGLAADVRTHLGAVERRSWEVDEDRVDDLLVRLAGEHAQESLLHDRRPLERAASLFDGALRTLTGLDPGTDELVRSAMGVPPPAAIERLAEVEVAAGAGGALWGLGGHGTGATTIRAGTITGPAHPSKVVELSSDSSAAVTAAVLERTGVSLPPAARSDVSMRLVIPTPPEGGTPDHLVVTTTSSDGDRIHEARSRIALSGRGPHSSSATATGVMDALARGDLVEATRLVVRLDVPADRIVTRSGVAELTGSTLAGGATGGAGVGAGFSARGQVLHVDRG